MTTETGRVVPNAVQPKPCGHCNGTAIVSRRIRCSTQKSARVQCLECGYTAIFSRCSPHDALHRWNAGWMPDRSFFRVSASQVKKTPGDSYRRRLEDGFAILAMSGDEQDAQQPIEHLEEIEEP